MNDQNSYLSGVGRVFTWGYGNDGQLANNENKGRYAHIVLVHMFIHVQCEYIKHFPYALYAPLNFLLLLMYRAVAMHLK